MFYLGGKGGLNITKQKGWLQKIMFSTCFDHQSKLVAWFWVWSRADEVWLGLWVTAFFVNSFNRKCYMSGMLKLLLLIQNPPIFHFHDCGRKGNWRFFFKEQHVGKKRQTGRLCMSMRWLKSVVQYSGSPLITLQKINLDVPGSCKWVVTYL